MSHCIIDHGLHGEETVVNIYKTEEAYRQCIIDILVENNCGDKKDYEDLPTDDLVYELDHQQGENYIETGSYTTEVSVIERG